MNLADPLSLPHGPAWPNRLALAPLTNLQSHPDGSLGDDERRWLVARAEGGFGLTMTCAAYVVRAGNAWPGQLGVAEDSQLPALRRLADEIRAAGSVSSVQLHHGGIRASSAASGEQVVAPWDDEAKGARALTTAEVRQAVDDFVAAAVRSDRAGFDGVQVHGAHGYLAAQFLDARKNLRTDDYGGDLAGRSRFLWEVLRGIRESTRPDFQVGLRLSPERFGMDLGETVTLTGEILASGLVDHLDLSLWDVRKAVHGGADDDLLVAHFTDLPRHGVALGVAGKVLSAADATWCLDRGADFVTVGTGGILHHDFPARAIADPGWASLPQPVTRAHLEAESVGPAFVDYLATNWDDFVVG
ncbi:NADH:flavin oxidoreductase [Nocardioides sp.]|uniref:NADH:flavin oxidoreductase n=1 Tax=Nocardioides sp. TaxID=35761 RepID=UPI00271B06DA|nr:NADH:flavin oxidoreductase [Nocardioides sp.]MDO9456423.1 NADH:flavin oxidoreductase [Nocardioides sp.]